MRFRMFPLKTYIILLAFDYYFFEGKFIKSIESLVLVVVHGLIFYLYLIYNTSG
jgi:hypothetical protein